MSESFHIRAKTELGSFDLTISALATAPDILPF
jgi:hypothetical protein